MYIQPVRSDGSIVATYVTGSDGRFGSPLLTVGEYRIRLTDPADRYASKYYESSTDLTGGTVVVVSGVQTSTTDIGVTGRGSIGGTVTDRSGAALSGVEVRASTASGADFPHSGSTTTAFDGTYVIDRLDIGTYDVRFDDPTGLHRDEYFDDDPGSASTPVVVGPAGIVTGVDAALDRYPQISGTITGPDGAPLAAATVQVAGASSRSVSTDANGRYTFDPLVPGDYRIQASGSASSYGTKYHDDVYSFGDARITSVNFGDSVEGIDIQLGTSLVEFEIDSTSVDEDAGTATVWLNRRFGSSLTTTVPRVLRCGYCDGERRLHRRRRCRDLGGRRRCSQARHGGDHRRLGLGRGNRDLAAPTR
jgi:hypothetical protein